MKAKRHALKSCQPLLVAARCGRNAAAPMMNVAAFDLIDPEE